MAKPVQNGQSDDKKELKSPKKQTPVICYDSIFAENCDESMIEEVAEEVMEMTRGCLHGRYVTWCFSRRTLLRRRTDCKSDHPRKLGGAKYLQGSFLLVRIGLHRSSCFLRGKYDEYSEGESGKLGPGLHYNIVQCLSTHSL